MKRNLFLLFNTIVLLAIPSISAAGGFRLADQDPYATARGNAFVATADRPSAVYYNPAGITQSEEIRTHLGYYGVWFNADYHSPQGNSSSTTNKIKGPPQAFFTTPTVIDSVYVGAGLYSPYGLGIEWPDDSGFRTMVKEVELIHFTFNPVLAWKITPQLSIGAGPTLNYSELELSQGLSPNGVSDVLRFKGDAISHGFTAGILWQPATGHSFGARYISSTYSRLQGKTSASGLPTSQNSRATLPIPDSFAFGYSFQPTAKWNFELNADWTNWDRFDSIDFTNTPLGDASTTFDYKASWVFSVGATRLMENQYSISTGYSYSENASPQETFSPSIPDVDKHYLSLGIGKENSNWGWQIAYQFAFSGTRHIQGSAASFAGQSADGDYKVQTHALTFAITYRR